jgi:hypothetical protein
VLPVLVSPILYLPYFLVCSLASCLVHRSRFKYQFMYQTKICHFCTTIVELNAKWLTRCLIYWTINDSRSKYHLMCWRLPTSLDTRPWYRGNQFIKLYIHSPTVLPHLSPIDSSLYSLALLHPASIGRRVASRVLTAPSPPTSPAHKSSACHPCFSAPSGSKVTTLDLLLHQILYSFVLLSCALCSFTSSLAIVILLDL